MLLEVHIYLSQVEVLSLILVMKVYLKAKSKEICVLAIMTVKILEIAVLFGLIMMHQRQLNSHVKLKILYHHNKPTLPKNILQ